MVKISKDGLLEANNAIISGTVYATDGEFSGKISATKGDVGGWNISPSEISSGKLRLIGENGTERTSSLISGYSNLKISCGGKIVLTKQITQSASVSGFNVEDTLFNDKKTFEVRFDVKGGTYLNYSSCSALVKYYYSGSNYTSDSGSCGVQLDQEKN